MLVPIFHPNIFFAINTEAHHWHLLLDHMANERIIVVTVNVGTMLLGTDILEMFHSTILFIIKTITRHSSLFLHHITNESIRVLIYFLMSDILHETNDVPSFSLATSTLDHRNEIFEKVITENSLTVTLTNSLEKNSFKRDPD
ncbi:unnamed protein product [Rotaria magnacalcarata]